MKSHSWKDPHMVRTTRSLFRALGVTVGVFLFLFVLFHLVGSLYVSSIASKTTDAFKSGITREINYLKEQGDAVAQNESLIDRLLARDSDALINITKAEKDARSIGLMGVADADGVIISRTLSSKSLGQNAFVTVPVGRAVAQGKSVQSIEMTSFGNQLFITTARPIMHDGNMIGALFANYLTDDEYAARFRDKYLPDGSEIIFYTNEFGVYGDSISDPIVHKTANSYFNSGSDWIRNGISGKTVSFKNGSFYVIENVVFPGLEKSPGGALILTPRRDISTVTNLIIAFLTLLTFVIIVSRFHIRNRGEEHTWRYYVLFIALTIPVIVIAFFALHLENIGFLELKRIPYILYNSTLRLQPESGVYDKDFEQRVSIFVDTGDESINAVRVNLLFDPNAVKVSSLEMASSTCSYVIENSVDPKLGTANLACVILKSDDDINSFRIADIVLVPKKTGTFTLSFDDAGTEVLANDGLGTNVLRMSQSGSYQVEDFDASTTKSLVVFSSTHPNQSRWYNAQNAHFVWNGEKNAVYKYILDSSPDTIPTNTHTVQGSATDVSIPGDGIFYFHVQAVSGGAVAHFRLQSDMTPPSIASIHISADKVVVGDVVRLTFEAEDTASGIQKNYYVDLGNHLFLPIGSQLFVPFLNVGDQKVTLRVYDSANNYSEKSQIIHVENP